MWEGANVFFHVLILKEIIKLISYFDKRRDIIFVIWYVHTRFFSGYVVERKIIREKKERDGKNGTHTTHTK